MDFVVIKVKDVEGEESVIVIKGEDELSLLMRYVLSRY